MAQFIESPAVCAPRLKLLGPNKSHDEFYLICVSSCLIKYSQIISIFLGIDRTYAE